MLKTETGKFSQVNQPVRERSLNCRVRAESSHKHKSSHHTTYLGFLTESFLRELYETTLEDSLAWLNHPLTLG